MLNEQELKQAVQTAVDDGTTPAVVNTPEVVTSPEVNVEPKVETPVVETKVENVDAAKLREQIDNLNIALKQERESSKGTVETINNLKKQLEESSVTLNKMKEVFTPAEPEPKQVETTPQYLTPEQLEDYLSKREEERNTENTKKEYAQKIKDEISSLEVTWDGQEGKPKYDDEKVIEWQDKNKKLHLTPSEAFFEMSRESIIDWEIKQRMSKKPDVSNVERPGGTPGGRELNTPEKPKTELELRQQVMDAIDAAMADTNT